MKKRCGDKTDKHYGGKGVTVCNEWLDFQAFHDWAMSAGYAPGLTIDRKDNAMGYSPENCRWASYKQQARNRTIVRMADKDTSWAEVAEANSVPVTVMNNRICAGGWSEEKAATTPLGTKRPKQNRGADGRFIAATSSWRR